MLSPPDREPGFGAPTRLAHRTRLAVSEADHQAAIVRCAQLLGWTCAHFRPARTERGWRTPVGADGAGFPDLVMTHPEHGLVFVECKSERGKVGPRQREWLKLLKAAGAEVYVWKPSDWPSIEARLRGAQP